MSNETQVHRVFIKASPEQVWDAITDPKWNARYGYRCQGDYDLRPGGAYRVLASDEMKGMGSLDVIIDGEVLESDPPRKLVQTWRALFTPETTAEGFTKLTWEIVEQYGTTRLTLTHELVGAPLTAVQVSGELDNAGGGWPFILSDLKTMLETGSPFSG
jgi:uncharacterized protein YndB with AHSA1/START domain